jgi:hypothetical protein
MSTSALPPTASTTLVILLGASGWPNSPGFQASQAFAHAAQGFKDYMLHPQGLGLPAANLLDQFDATFSASDQLEMLGSFLEQRTQALSAANQAVRDVLVYFVGHGGFVGPSADFYLLPRRANASSLRASGIAIDALAEVLREKARQTRRYLFLDCCFAAAAFRAFQGGPDQTAITKTLDAFHVQAKSSGFPRKGTVLLCSSDQKTPSLLLPDESCTMFSHALLDVLRNGDRHRPPQLSLRDLKELTEDRLVALPEKNAPRPGLYSPDQSEGDAANVPFFPNPRAQKERMRHIEEERRHQAAGPFFPLPSPPFVPGHQPGQEPPLRGVVASRITRRKVIVGLGLAGLTIAGGGLVWLTHSYSTPTPVYTYRGHAAGVGAVAWSPNSKRIASGSDDNTVQVWDAANGGHVYTYQGHSNSVQAVAWSPGGPRIASGGGDESGHDFTVQVWDAADGGHVYTYRGHSGVVNAVAWSPDGKRIASGSNDKTVKAWDAVDGGHVYTYQGHTDGVTAVAWSPDGKRIASGSNDKTVQVWDAADGRNVFTYPGHSNFVFTVAWSPDGRSIASGSNDKTVQVWPAE